MSKSECVIIVSLMQHLDKTIYSLQSRELSNYVPVWLVKNHWLYVQYTITLIILPIMFAINHLFYNCQKIVKDSLLIWSQPSYSTCFECLFRPQAFIRVGLKVNICNLKSLIVDWWQKGSLTVLELSLDLQITRLKSVQGPQTHLVHIES